VSEPNRPYKLAAIVGSLLVAGLLAAVLGIGLSEGVTSGPTGSNSIVGSSGIGFGMTGNVVVGGTTLQAQANAMADRFGAVAKVCDDNSSQRARRCFAKHGFPLGVGSGSVTLARSQYQPTP
jgi:cysteine synthase